MESDFESVTRSHNYVAALIAASRRFFRRVNRLDCAKDIVVPPIAERQAYAGENVYQDPDPPTPNWGC